MASSRRGDAPLQLVTLRWPLVCVLCLCHILGPIRQRNLRFRVSKIPKNSRLAGAAPQAGAAMRLKAGAARRGGARGVRRISVCRSAVHPDPEDSRYFLSILKDSGKGGRTTVGVTDG